MEKQGWWRWQNTKRRGSRRCSQVPGQAESAGNTRVRKALCAKTNPGDCWAPQLCLSGDPMVQLYPPRPKNKKPPVPELQSQRMGKHPLAAPKLGLLSSFQDHWWWLKAQACEAGWGQPGLPQVLQDSCRAGQLWHPYRRFSAAGDTGSPSHSSWAWTGIATGAQHTLPGSR